MVKDLNTNLRGKLSVFTIFSGAVGVIAFFLAMKLSPWFYAINTRVRLYLDAPAETKILVCWDKSQVQCLPLVPYSSLNHRIAENGEVADIWLSELPPRSMYSISLVFKSKPNGATFHVLELDSSHIILYGHVYGAGIGKIRFGISEFMLDKLSDNAVGNSHQFDGTSGGQLILKREIVPGPPDAFRGERLLKVWSILFSIYILIMIPIYFLPHAIQNLGSAIRATHVRNYAWWVYMVFTVIIVSMLWVVVKSGVIFNEYDALNYLLLAVSGNFFSDTRLPGYPIFLRLALWVSHYNLNGVIFLQASILALSVIICIWVLRRWIAPLPAILFVLLSVFSPAQIHWSRWILRESLFSSLLLLGTTAAIAHFTSSNPGSKIWIYVFAVICGYAFLVRENGLLLPVVLLPALLPQVIKQLLSSDTIWERIKSLFFLGLRYLSPVLALVVVYAGFSTYNYLHYGYFQLGIHQTSHAFLARTIYPGNSDVRSLLDPGSSVSEEAKSYSGWPLYSSFIVAQEQAPGLDPIYVALYPLVKQQMADRGVPLNTFHLANILNGIGKGMSNLVPTKANVSGLLRLYTEIISLNIRNTYPLQVSNPYATDSSQGLLNRLPMHITLEEKIIKPDSILAKYYNATQQYKWYAILLMLALLSSLYILRYEDPAFLAPITIFIVNCGFLIATRLVNDRYIVNLDVLLILQLVLGLSLWVDKHIPSQRSIS